MLSEPITKERLQKFYAYSVYAEKLTRQIEEFKTNYNSLKSIDTSKTKVINGNSITTSEQEQYLAVIENKTKKLDKVRSFVNGEKIIIETQIERMTNPEYKDILTERYLKLKDWKNISLEYFGNEKDYWTYRESKYHFIIMTWHKRAVAELKKISEKPYIPIETQLTLGGIHD